MFSFFFLVSYDWFQMLINVSFVIVVILLLSFNFVDLRIEEV